MGSLLANAEINCRYQRYIQPVSVNTLIDWNEILVLFVQPSG